MKSMNPSPSDRVLTSLAAFIAAATGLAMTVLAPTAGADPLGTAFTYQGRLMQEGRPFTGGADVAFNLYGSATGTDLVGAIPSTRIDITKGLFTQVLNFGAVFDGNTRWLEINVNGVALSPRQPITPVPYALRTAGIDGHSLDAIDGNPIDAVHVNGAGRVGVGTTTPEMSLEVVTESHYGRPALGVSYESSPGVDKYVYLHGSDDHSIIWNDTSVLRFGTETSRETGYVERMRITHDGKVGIGTTTPEFPLHTVGSAKISDGNLHLVHTASSPFISLRNTEPGGQDWRITSTDEGATGGAGQLWITGTASGNVFNVQPNGNIGIGTTSPKAKLDVAGETRTRVLRITGGADLAESFHISGPITPQPGLLVAIDRENPGALRVTSQPYDRTVAGVISGANAINPGLVLAQEGTVADGKHPVALTGRVYAFCDAEAGGPIEPGDLLCSSGTAGHAMKAVDSHRAAGAVIGKAMTALESGQGLVLVLVSLQ